MGKVFYGTYNRSLDSKGRLQLPSDFDCEDGDTLYVMKGLDGCISVFPEDRFIGLTERLSTMDYAKAADRAFIRETLRSAKKLKVDSHGRISLTVELLRKYSIDASVLILGSLDRFEIWDPATYEAYEKSLDSYEALAERAGA